MNKHIDPLSIAVAGMLVGGSLGAIGILYGYKTDTKTLFWSGITSIIIATIAALYFAYLYTYGTAKVVENHHQYTWYKPENGTEPQYLAPGKTAPRVDGISTAQETDKVFKCRNGQHFKVTKEGQVKNVNAISRALNAGWEKRNELPGNWEPLFNKANAQPVAKGGA